ncbi:MAG: DUF3301 domain-containing protein [Gammaproteobacteria bacterium]|nr:DUF3301 domain-containing protein [Gammaproteobacteria bacterium]MBU0771531.1 DUF3301 domain-containing protein [Gammaproteobacteria bacterium]MBU0856040.1 DUF3301 domain-containing protein [Gammaproteobacteria bacterium]MBU1846625.1 DUF3301 domain-containing protein [Gammaproteobacteria bacterium]
MPVFEITSLLLIGGLIWIWLDSLNAREIGMEASRAACRSEGAQLLDDSVAIRSTWLARDDGGQVRIKRTYAFEYSDTGNNRRHGSVTLLGKQVIALYIAPHVV